MNFLEFNALMVWIRFPALKNFLCVNLDFRREDVERFSKSIGCSGFHYNFNSFVFPLLNSFRASSAKIDNLL